MKIENKIKNIHTHTPPHFLLCPCRLLPFQQQIPCWLFSLSLWATMSWPSEASTTLQLPCELCMCICPSFPIWLGATNETFHNFLYHSSLIAPWELQFLHIRGYHLSACSLQGQAAKPLSIQLGSHP